MTFLMICMLIAGCVTSGLIGYVRGAMKVRKAQTALEGPASSAPIKALTSKRHKLERTFRDRKITLAKAKSGQDFHGWHFICTCGTIAPAVDNMGISQFYGTDAGAIKAWRKHMELHAELVDSGDNELAEVRAEFEKYKQECFCHDLEGK